jgi:26S proteasome regulatory subunit N2
MRMLILMQETLDEPNYLFLCRAWQDLGETREVSRMLLYLAGGNEDSALFSFQLAFNLVRSGSQRFICNVLETMNKELSMASDGLIPDSGCAGGFATSMSPHQEYVEKLRLILSIDGVSNELQLKFLSSKCETDILLLRNMKDAIDGSRSSILHNALVIAHSVMNAGTANTAFLRENLDWMGKATNWAKFNATASIGVIHMGHIKKSLELLKPYLPVNTRGISDSPYSEGGALYALGLIHANRGHGSKSVVVERLRHAIRHAGNSEPLQHGACLGIGLAAMGTGDPELYDEMKAVLFFDSAVAGEAAAFGIGLLLAGHGMRTQQSRAATSDLLSYAHETSHEKIIRSIVISIALIVFGQENLAEPVIQQLCRDRDAIIRYGGAFAISLAYAGTANNSAVKRLLHVAVSDVSDDVRRAAVMCLGIVLYRTPHKVPTLVALLSESFNPHVRYGACLAIGIACAGTGNSDSLLLLQPMLNDPVDFVRQGCLLALSLIFMLQTEFSCPSVKSFRGKLASIVSDKYPSILTKLGAIIAAGIIDAGGRNCSLSLSSPDGFVRSTACVGMALWLQHWYWFPMLHFFSLALAPSMLVGLNKDFQLPQSFSVYCAAPALRYAYPPKLREKQETKRERVITAILSTTLKQQARERARGKEDELVTQKHIATSQNTNRKVRQVEAKKQTEFHDDGYYFLTNPTRIINTQQSHCAFLLDGRYTPAATKMKPVGVIMLIDHSPAEVADAIDIDRIPLVSHKEADVPSPFAWPN